MEKVREKVLFALQEVQRAVIGKQEVTETVMKAFWRWACAGGGYSGDLARRPWRLLFPERPSVRHAHGLPRLPHLPVSSLCRYRCCH